LCPITIKYLIILSDYNFPLIRKISYLDCANHSTGGASSISLACVVMVFLFEHHIFEGHALGVQGVPETGVVTGRLLELHRPAGSAAAGAALLQLLLLGPAGVRTSRRRGAPAGGSR
jgi:hypothetical protein